MPKGRFIVSVLAGLAMSSGIGLADGFLPSEVLIQLDPLASIRQFNARYGTSTLDSLPPLYRLDVPDGMEEDALIELIMSDSSVVDADYVWETETPEGSRQMVVTAVGETLEGVLAQDLVQHLRLAAIHAAVDGDGIAVAVLDTGIRPDHEMLAAVVAPDGYDFVDRDDGPLDQANGSDDDLDGWIDEGAGHGTMVAGIVHLVAPKARILPVRVLDDEGRGTVFNIAMGVRWAVDHGARIVNLSLGLYHSSFALRHEVDRALDRGVAVVAAAGNDAREHPAFFPSSSRGVIAVAGLDTVDVKADFSNWGSHVDISAPSVAILGPYHDGGYAIGSGTSFAAPIIAGQCALILSFRDDLSTDEVAACARGGVLDISSIEGNEPYRAGLGAGRVDGEATWDRLQQVSEVTGSRATAATDWIAYPNPAEPGIRLQIRTGGPLDGGQPAANLYDLSGRRVRQFRLIDLDRSGRLWRVPADDLTLRPGVYFLRLAAGGSESRKAIRIVMRGR